MIAPRLVLLAAVAGAHVAYYAAPQDSGDRGWIHYIGLHALAAVSLAALLPAAARGRWGWLGALACWWGIVESAQAIGCSALSWGTLSEADLCEQAFGHEVYLLAAALAIAWLLTDRMWRARHG